MEKTDKTVSVIVLGSGNGHALPKEGCDCPQCKEAAEKGLSARMKAACLIDCDRRLILFDCGPDIKEQMKDLIPEAVFVTHRHGDHIMGVPDLPMGTVVYLQRGAELPDGVKIDPFVVTHAKDTTTVGFIFKYKDISVAYAPDFLRIDEPKSIKGVSVAVLCGNSLVDDVTEPAGHQSIYNSLKMCKELEIKSVIFTHIGHMQFTHSQLEEKVRSMAQEVGVDPNKVYVAYDRIQFYAHADGVEYVPPTQIAMVKAREVVAQMDALQIKKDSTGTVEGGGGGVYGAGLRPTTGDNVARGNDSPSEGIGEVLSEDDMNSLKKVDSGIKCEGGLRKQKLDYYDPTELDNRQLADDWRVLSAFYKMMKSGSAKYTEDQIVKAGEQVMSQLVNRKAAIYHPDAMDEDAAEFYKVIRDNVAKSGVKVPENRLTGESLELLEKAVKAPNLEIMEAANALLSNVSSILEVAVDLARDVGYRPADDEMRCMYCGFYHEPDRSDPMVSNFGTPWCPFVGFVDPNCVCNKYISNEPEDLFSDDKVEELNNELEKAKGAAVVIHGKESPEDVEHRNEQGENKESYGTVGWQNEDEEGSHPTGHQYTAGGLVTSLDAKLLVKPKEQQPQKINGVEQLLDPASKTGTYKTIMMEEKVTEEPKAPKDKVQDEKTYNKGLVTRSQGATPYPGGSGGGGADDICYSEEDKVKNELAEKEVERVKKMGGGATQSSSAPLWVKSADGLVNQEDRMGKDDKLSKEVRELAECNNLVKLVEIYKQGSQLQKPPIPEKIPMVPGAPSEQGVSSKPPGPGQVLQPQTAMADGKVFQTHKWGPGEGAQDVATNQDVNAQQLNMGSSGDNLEEKKPLSKPREVEELVEQKLVSMGFVTPTTDEIKAVRLMVEVEESVKGVK
jgi:phosphoribosyl 1,2-cyclic phosphodiesterase